MEEVMKNNNFAKARLEMVVFLRRNDIRDQNVLAAMGKLPREIFVPEQYKGIAYADTPHQIGYGATISQPLTVALMLEALQLEKKQHVLEVGAGCGYVVALLREIVGKEGEVTGIEIVPELSKEAKKYLTAIECSATIICSDGSKGYEKNAPYDRIVISCACPSVPKQLFNQLKNNGILLAPVGRFVQTLMRYKKTEKKIKKESLQFFRFVPMRGKSERKQ